MDVTSYVEGSWVKPSGDGQSLRSAVTNEEVARLYESDLDYRSITQYARQKGGPALREKSIHDRALMVKEIAKHLMSQKDKFYEWSSHTGATKSDSWIDIEGGISTLFVSSSKARRQMPDLPFHVDGKMEQLSREGTFVGQHIHVPREGVAVHINSFNFPCWGMLEKLGPTLIAGMPAIIKPSPTGSYLSKRMVEEILSTDLLPEGALQFIAADIPGDLLDHLVGQDVVAFTGSRETGVKLQSHPNIIEQSVRFNLEVDSLNASILGPDVSPGMEEFDLFVQEVLNEITIKAGQRCTAIRRALVPEQHMDAVVDRLKKKLSNVTLGHPSDDEVNMGTLASSEQFQRFNEHLESLADHTQRIYAGNDITNKFDPSTSQNGIPTCPPILLYTPDPKESDKPHDIEAFGPVSTLMPYNSTDDAITIANKSRGSLVGSIFTADDQVAEELTRGLAPYHGRIMIVNRDCADEQTGHGSPLPHLTHGGPGRAGGGEEMGGIRGILHYMQRVALQGSPTTLTQICKTYMYGSETRETKSHPFKKHFEELEVGDHLKTHRRTVTEADIVNFGCISGDHFYAHFDDLAARDSIFEERVAHGYFILSASAGMFVDPAPGPVLANYGLDNLRFVEPVKIGDTIQAHLTVKSKHRKETKESDEIPKGIVKWNVEVTNQENESVALYDILTLVRRKESWKYDAD